MEWGGLGGSAGGFLPPTPILASACLRGFLFPATQGPGQAHTVCGRLACPSGWGPLTSMPSCMANTATLASGSGSCSASRSARAPRAWPMCPRHTLATSSR